MSYVAWILRKGGLEGMLKCNKSFWRGYYIGWIVTAICCLLAMFLLFYADICHAIEVVRQKNVATYIVYPIVDVNGDTVTSAGGLDTEIDAWADGSAPDGFADASNEATEIGSTGMYYLSLTQSEMNNDYLIVTTSTTTTDAKSQHILIRTLIGDPLNIATTDDGGTIDVTGGAIDEVAALTGHTAQTGDSYAIVNSGTYGNSALKTLVDDVVTHTGTTIPGMITTNSGTLNTIESKIDTIDDYVDTEVAAIFADTDELQTNQGNWATATGFSTHSAADVWSVATRVLTANTNLNDPTASSIADAVWNETLSEHLGAGSTGETLNAAGAAGDPWTTTLPGAYGAGSAGFLVGSTIPGMITTNGASLTAMDTKIETIDDYVDTEIAAILEDTGTTLPASLVTIQADLDSPNQYKADVSGVATAVNLATVDTVVDAIKAKTDNLPADPADASVVAGLIATAQADLDNPAQYKATGFSTHSAADVWTNGTRTLSAFSFDAGLTAAAVDAIWDEAITGHSTADSFGKVIDDQIDGLRAYGDGSWIKGTTVY